MYGIPWEGRQYKSTLWISIFISVGIQHKHIFIYTLLWYGSSIIIISRYDRYSLRFLFVAHIPHNPSKVRWAHHGHRLLKRINSRLGYAYVRHGWLITPHWFSWKYSFPRAINSMPTSDNPQGNEKSSFKQVIWSNAWVKHRYTVIGACCFAPLWLKFIDILVYIQSDIIYIYIVSSCIWETW